MKRESVISFGPATVRAAALPRRKHNGQIACPARFAAESRLLNLAILLWKCSQADARQPALSPNIVQGPDLCGPVFPCSHIVVLPGIHRSRFFLARATIQFQPQTCIVPDGSEQPEFQKITDQSLATPNTRILSVRNAQEIPLMLTNNRKGLKCTGIAAIETSFRCQTAGVWI